MLSQMSLRQVVRQWDHPNVVTDVPGTSSKTMGHPNVVTDVPGTSSGGQWDISMLLQMSLG